MAKLSRIAPEMPVYDLRESIEYYEQKLGFRLVMEMSSGDYAIIERDGVAIHLFQDDARTHSPIGVHIFTHQLDELHTEFVERGARISQEFFASPGAIVISTSTIVRATK